MQSAAMGRITGLHHVTAIAGDAQENMEFYTRVLGMRLVKRSVNQDAPGTYHLFYADAAGSPGTDLTFFPWPEMAPARHGHGLAMETSLAVPAGSLGYWQDRLAANGVELAEVETRRGGQVLPFRDPHGLPLALTSRFLVDVMGFTALGEDDGWHGFAAGEGGSGTIVELREAPRESRGQWGTGGVHHVAWRVADEASELAARERVAAARRRPTEVIDRFWFKSVYFLEPGGVLFELATDGPGFGVDEPMSSLGERLVLPPWLEPHRVEIESALPLLRLTAEETAGD